MKIVIDNNIALDALLERKPFCETAEQILTACADSHTGYLTSNSLTDIFYVLRKAIGNINAKAAVKKLIDLFEIISVDKDDCLNAVSLQIDDFEDALIVVCAEKVSADCIVTRDEKFMQDKSPVAIISSKDLIKNL